MITIGITGTSGAGKGTIVEYLLTRGFGHYSVRDFIAREVKKRGLALDRANLIAVGNDLRARFSAGYIVESLYEEAAAAGKNAVIESIRTLGEVKALRQKSNFYLLAVDAPLPLRYERIRRRAVETDQVSYEEFLAADKLEANSSDENKQNILAAMAAADFTVSNDDTKDNLFREIEKILNKIRIK